MKSYSTFKKNLSLPSPEGGQILIEYILLLVVVVAIAAAIVKGFASRSADEPGILIQTWDDLIKTIGDDIN